MDACLGGTPPMGMITHPFPLPHPWACMYSVAKQNVEFFNDSLLTVNAIQPEIPQKCPFNMFQRRVRPSFSSKIVLTLH